MQKTTAVSGRDRHAFPAPLPDPDSSGPGHTLAKPTTLKDVRGHLLAIVEITGEIDPAVQRNLVCAAYRASREGPVILLLRGVERCAVDRLLDAAVRGFGTQVRGVRYVEDTAIEAWVHSISAATTVVASSRALRDAAAEWPCRALSAERAIEEWSGNTEMSAPAAMERTRLA
jgi:hypothetical protein